MTEWNYNKADVEAKMIVDSSTGSKRADAGKLRYDLIPPRVIEDLTKVLTGGAQKYGDHNWSKNGGMRWTRCYSSMMRHIQAWYGGEDTDPESGLSHLAHAMCNLSFLMEYERINQDGDDRPFKRKS